MGKTDIITMALGFFLLLMPMWTAVVARLIFRGQSQQLIAFFSAVPFLIWRLVMGDLQLFLKKLNEMDQMWMKAFFMLMGICLLQIPFLFSKAGGLIVDRARGEKTK